MLLIIFYGEFYSFHKPVTPRLESQFNHREFKLKSELQIKNWRKRSSAEKNQAALAILQGLRNFIRLRNFSTPAKFPRAANLATPIVDFFFLYSFLSLPNLSLCNSDSLLIFW